MKPLSIWTYVISLALWLSLCFAAMAIVLDLEIRDVQKDLKQYGDAYSDHLDKEMISSEAILQGFSALFNAIGDTDPDKASRYVRQVIKNNPHIFALEIVQAVTKNQLGAFVAQKRRDGTPDFNIKSFSYDSDRKWQALREKPIYYPIVFREPMPSGSEVVLGLDMTSVPFLQRAMTESLLRREPVASHPFRLVQGNLAYVVFYPISPSLPRNGSTLAYATQDKYLVNMVIDAEKLAEPVKFAVFDGGTALVYHKDFRPDDPKGQLLKMSGKGRSSAETALFPTFIYQKPLATMGEPFSLMVKRQVGWSDLNLGLLTLLAFLTLISSVTLVMYLRIQQQGRSQQIENQKRLWQLANHDGLTGLPNRMLLMDRLEQMLARMLRQEKRMAVIFLDLDDFKQVNDIYGHEIGDQLLKFVAERLRTTVRADDTVARLCGDEFIILMESVENREALDAVKDKIRQKLSDGFFVKDQLIRVKASIGIAMLPEDGDSPETLMKQADVRMYEDKKARTAKLHMI